jgi:endo-1,4-beta-xylanase
MQRLAYFPSLCLLSLSLAACSDDSGSRPGAQNGDPGAPSAGAGGTGSAPIDRDPGMTLRMMADPMERYIGVAVRTDRLRNPPYADAARDFNALTHENEMKWESIEPQPGMFAWGNADATIAFAEMNGMAVRGHTLVWHSQLAAWVRALTTRDEVLGAMERHISEVVGRYKGRVFAWDVVNEAFTDGGMMAPRLRGADPADADDPQNTNGNSGRDSIFRRLIGEDYIDRAFVAANAADPDAKLFYNDFNAEGAGAKSDAVYNMVSGMVARGIPIHGVGLQMHVGTNANDRNRTPEAIAANMQRIAELGLEIHITELDVALCGMGAIETRREQQRQRLAGITQVCLDQPKCTSITVWGVGDSDSWRDRECQMGVAESGRTEPVLFDSSYQRKDAYYAVFDAFAAAMQQ